MAGPQHEQLPEESRKPGPRPDLSGAEQILLRVVTVGSLMHKNGWSLQRIFVWNQDPEQIKNGWGYGYRHIHRLVKRAKLLGAEFLCKSHGERILTSLNEWMELRGEAVLLGDIRAAAYCQKEIDKLRDAHAGKHLRGITPLHGGGGHGRYKWAEIAENRVSDVQDANIIPT